MTAAEALSALQSLLVPLTVGAGAYLLKRAIDGVDRKLDALDAKVGTLSAKDGEHDVGLVELRVRVSHLEAEVPALRLRVDDHGGFLSVLGFRKRGPAGRDEEDTEP